MPTQKGLCGALLRALAGGRRSMRPGIGLHACGLREQKKRGKEMGHISRRAMLASAGLGAMAAGIPAGWGEESSASGAAGGEAATGQSPLALAEYEPQSMLHVKKTHIEKARYPVIDFHTHITESAHEVKGVAVGEARAFNGQPQELLPVMDRRNLRALVNLTGGFGAGLRDSVSKLDRSHDGRFYSMTEPSYNLFGEANYPQLQAEAIEQAHRDGARGLKILKTLGLFLREHTTTGTLVKIDDPRFDPM